MSVKILIAADIVPVETNIDLFRQSDTLSLVGKELFNRLTTADFIVMNLEVPLVNEKSPIRKCGPNLIATTDTIKGLKAIDPYFFTLANNHILDQGAEGLRSTIRVLKENGIAFSGAGENLKEAVKPYTRNIGGYHVGFYCCAEHEFSIATETNPGANPYDPLTSFDAVFELKKRCDFVFVLYHGGKEHYRYPSPMLQKVFRKFADCGADFVIAQHTHCIGCMETYKESTLVYGQGNFLFDNSESDYWKTSLLIEFDLQTKRINYIPLVKNKNTVREAMDECRKEILDGFLTRSKEITVEGFIQKKYAEFAQKMCTDYILRFSGSLKKNIIVRVLNKLTSYRFMNLFYPDDSKVVIENILDCEAHRELASEIIKSNRTIREKES